MTRRLRHAARAVVLDEAERVLLVCFRFPDRDVWAAPGGGLHEGETHELALRRELEEEAGLTDFELGPCLWIRDDQMPSIDGVYDAQFERYYLVRVSQFEVDPRLTAAELAAENVADVRWWTLDELASAKELFAQRRLVQLLRQLLEYGRPTTPIETGV